MLRVEYYWDTFGLKGDLLVTYYLKGDGTRGWAELEPFPENQNLGKRDRDFLGALYEKLQNWPEALMFEDLDAMTLDRAWTEELVREQSEKTGLIGMRPFIVSLDAPKGVSYKRVLRRRRTRGKATVVRNSDTSRASAS